MSKGNNYKRFSDSLDDRFIEEMAEEMKGAEYKKDVRPGIIKYAPAMVAVAALLLVLGAATINILHNSRRENVGSTSAADTMVVSTDETMDVGTTEITSEAYSGSDISINDVLPEINIQYVKLASSDMNLSEDMNYNLPCVIVDSFSAELLGYSWMIDHGDYGEMVNADAAPPAFYDEYKNTIELYESESGIMFGDDISFDKITVRAYYDGEQALFEQVDFDDQGIYRIEKGHDQVILEIIYRDGSNTATFGVRFAKDKGQS